MIHVIQQSCLEKIKADARDFKPNYESASVLVNEEFAYQIILYTDENETKTVSLELQSSDEVKLFEVKQVPVLWPHYDEGDTEQYLADTPTLLPDALVPLKRRPTLNLNKRHRVFWVSIRAAFPGDHDIDLYLNGEFRSRFHLRVLPYKIPASSFANCQYIDPCSIAKAYKTALFSDVHWKLLEKYFKIAANHGVTHVLTPIYPPVYEDYPLGNEHIQLVQISKNNLAYEFNYDLLDSWICIARKSGIKKFTFPPIIPSLKTLECPRLKMTSEWEERYIFDEQTNVLSHEFSTFIRKFMRDLLKHLKMIGAHDDVAFQFSHAPSAEDEENYMQCRAIIKQIIRAHQIADTKVSPEFVRLEIGSAPFFSTAEPENFLAFPINRHLYMDNLSPKSMINTLISAPSMRIRAFGTLCYCNTFVSLFNLWFSNYFQKENEDNNALFDASNQNSLPSGLGFLVYPAFDEPIPSIRLKQLHFALQDVAVLKQIGSIIPRERIVSRIEKKYKIMINKALIDADEFLKMREELYSLLNN